MRSSGDEEGADDAQSSQHVPIVDRRRSRGSGPTGLGESADTPSSYVERYGQSRSNTAVDGSGLRQSHSMDAERSLALEMEEAGDDSLHRHRKAKNGSKRERRERYVREQAECEAAYEKEQADREEKNIKGVSARRQRTHKSIDDVDESDIFELEGDLEKMELDKLAPFTPSLSADTGFLPSDEKFVELLASEPFVETKPARKPRFTFPHEKRGPWGRPLTFTGMGVSNASVISDVHFDETKLGFSIDKFIRFGCLKTGESLGNIKVLSGQHVVTSMDFSHDTIVCGGSDRTLRAFNWDYELRLTTAKRDGHREPVTSVRLEKGSQRFVSSGMDGKVKIWATTTSQCLRTLNDNSVLDGSALGLQLLGERMMMAVGASSGSGAGVAGAGGYAGWLGLWDARVAERGGLVSKVQSESPLFSVSAHASSHTVACGGDDGVVTLWDTRKLEELGPLVVRGPDQALAGGAHAPGRAGPVVSVHVDGTRLLAAQPGSLDVYALSWPQEGPLAFAARAEMYQRWGVPYANRVGHFEPAMINRHTPDRTRRARSFHKLSYDVATDTLALASSAGVVVWRSGNAFASCPPPRCRTPSPPPREDGQSPPSSKRSKRFVSHPQRMVGSGKRSSGNFGRR